MITALLLILVMSGAWLAASVKFIIEEWGDSSVVVPGVMFVIVGAVFFPTLFRLVFVLINGYDPG